MGPAVLFYFDFKPVYARNDATTTAIQLAHRGTTNPPITASHPYTTRATCNTAIIKKINPVIR
jgi:hypothetical protein